MRTEIKNQNHIWEIKTGISQYDNYISSINFLSSEELQKYNNYKNKNTQVNYLICRIALRNILGYYLQMPPQDIKVENSLYGKPFLKDYPSLYFNLSHSGDKALIIVSDSEVGIDIEYIDLNLKYWEITNYCFSQKECELIKAQRYRFQKCIKFFELWTQKEALLKCLGTGLTEDIKNINLQNFNKSAVLNGNQDQWHLHTFTDLNNQYIFSVAYKALTQKQFLYDFYCLPTFINSFPVAFDQAAKELY